MSTKREREPGQRGPSPTEAFLGVDAARGGPFALLGLEPSAADDAAILDARDRRMRQIDEHPLAETPEADEVRLSLYASAAQLLNPSVRARLAESWGVPGSRPAPRPVPDPRADSAPTRGVGTGADAVRPGGPSTRERLLEHDAILALAMFGGWNKRSLRRIASIAHARGMGSGEVASTLRRIGHRRRPHQRPAGQSRAAVVARTPPPAFGDKPNPGSPLDEQIDPAQRLLKMAALLVVVAVVTLASLIVGVVGLMNLAAPNEAPVIVENEDANAATPPSSPRVTAPITRNTSRPRVLPAPDALGDPELVIRELDASRRAFELTPFEATRRFSDAVALFASTWVAFDPEARERGIDAAERFLELSSSEPDASRLAIDAVGAGLAPLSGADRGALGEREVWPAVWSAGMLARVRSSSLLSSAQRAQGDRLLRLAAPDLGAGATGFVRGGVAGARLARDRLVRVPPENQAWVRWIESVDALAAGEETVRTILLSEALDELLAPPAGEVEARSAGIERVTLALSWRRGSGARRWLLRTLDHPAATSGALSRLIGALASRSAAPGIDATVSLSPNADMRERGALRTRLERAWRLDQAGELDSLAGDLRAAMASIFRERPLRSDPQAQFVLGVRLALLNAAASLMRDASFEAAADAIARAAAIETRRPNRVSDTAPLSTRAGPDGLWALRFDEADSDADERISLLNALGDRGGEIGPVDAEVLVETAVNAAPRLVEQRARETLRGFLDTPAVLNALLEQVVEMPRSVDMIDIIELATATPISRDTRDGAWRAQAHRALVATLIGMLAHDSRWGGVDDLLHELADAYQLGATAVPVSAGESGAPAEAVRLLRMRWRREAHRAGPAGLAGLDADGIERRRVARLELATTPIQAFLGEQLAACETLALLTSSERAGVGPEVAGVLGTLDERLDQAGHIAEQIASCEEAIARLWLIREGLNR